MFADFSQGLHRAHPILEYAEPGGGLIDAAPRLVGVHSAGHRSKGLQSGLVAALAGVALAAAAVPAMGQGFPVKPVRLIVPFAPGGPNDISGRIFAAKLAERRGQQVIVDNRGGASTIIGAQLAANAPPDGYPLFQASAGTLVNNPLLYSKRLYDAKTSFAPISLIAGVT